MELILCCTPLTPELDEAMDGEQGMAHLPVIQVFVYGINCREE